MLLRLGKWLVRMFGPSDKWFVLFTLEERGRGISAACWVVGPGEPSDLLFNALCKHLKQSPELEDKLDWDDILIKVRSMTARPSCQTWFFEDYRVVINVTPMELKGNHEPISHTFQPGIGTDYDVEG